MVIGLLCLIGVFLGHPVFSIQKVEVKGSNFINRDIISKQLEQLVDKNIGSLLFTKKFLWQLKNIHPALDQIKLKIKFPNQVSAVVIEKEPWVTFLSGNNNYIVSADGAIMNKDSINAQIKNINELVIIRGVPERYFKKHYIDKELLQFSQILVENIQFYFPYENMQIEYLSKQHIDIIKDDTLTIKIGTLDMLDLKFRNLKKYLKRYENMVSKLEYIDLRVEDKVIVKRLI